MDIISNIIADTELWRIILYEAERVVNWYKDDYYRSSFELLLNEEESGYKYPVQIEIKDISNQIISKAISKSFNKYISKKLKEIKIEELTADEYNMKTLKKLKNKK